MELKEKILDTGTVKINHQPTRDRDPATGKDSCIEQAFTNRPDRISSHETISPTFSDNYLVIINRNSNRMEGQRQFRKARSFRNFDKSKFANDIIEHPKYLETLHKKDTEVISENIVQIMQESLDIQAPVKMTQVKQKLEKLSTESREQIAIRDTTHKMAKETGKIEDLRNFRIQRNLTNKIVGKERFERKVAKFNKEGTTMKEKCMNAKTEVGNAKIVTPKIIIDGDSMYTKPRDIVNIFNRQFKKK